MINTNKIIKNIIGETTTRKLKQEKNKIVINELGGRKIIKSRSLTEDECKKLYFIYDKNHPVRALVLDNGMLIFATSDYTFKKSGALLYMDLKYNVFNV